MVKLNKEFNVRRETRIDIPLEKTIHIHSFGSNKDIFELCCLELEYFLKEPPPTPNSKFLVKILWLNTILQKFLCQSSKILCTIEF